MKSTYFAALLLVQLAWCVAEGEFDKPRNLRQFRKGTPTMHVQGVGSLGLDDGIPLLGFNYKYSSDLLNRDLDTIEVDDIGKRGTPDPADPFISTLFGTLSGGPNDGSGVLNTLFGGFGHGTFYARTRFGLSSVALFQSATELSTHASNINMANFDLSERRTVSPDPNKRDSFDFEPVPVALDGIGLYTFLDTVYPQWFKEVYGRCDVVINVPLNRNNALETLQITLVDAIFVSHKLVMPDAWSDPDGQLYEEFGIRYSRINYHYIPVLGGNSAGAMAYACDPTIDLKCCNDSLQDQRYCIPGFNVATMDTQLEEWWDNDGQLRRSNKADPVFYGLHKKSVAKGRHAYEGASSHAKKNKDKYAAMYRKMKAMKDKLRKNRKNRKK